MTIKFAIITVSDTCSHNPNADKSGPKLRELVLSKFPTSKITYGAIVPDNKEMIEQCLLHCIQTGDCQVILTTGGTGFGPRDVTPEATKAVIQKETPGISNSMLIKSLNVTDKAMLSRATSGIRDNTLIINFPGSVKAASECFSFVADVLPHAVQLIQNNLEEVKSTHKQMQQFTESKVKINVNVTSRSRQSPFKMLEVEQALKLIFETSIPSSAIDYIDIDKAYDRVLAEDIVSADPLPPFPASIKDGYAVRSKDTNLKRKVQGVVAAGDSDEDPVPLAENECVRISTGAAVPLGADAVIQVEDTELISASEDGSKELEIQLKALPTIGQDIRPVGSDITANTVVLQKGETVDVGHVGVLATVGQTTVKVFSRPSIGVISTGNELQDPKEKLIPGHVRDSNKLTLIHLFKKYNYEADDCGIAKDDPNSVKWALESALLKHDIVITTGGVSMGEYDLVKQILVQDFDAKIHFGRVNMKPGKPTTYATCIYNNKPKQIFGLPGNPVSATVTALLFVFPTLRYCENRKEIHFPTITDVQIEGNYKNSDIRPEYARAKLQYKTGTFSATILGNQISSRINSFVGANALVFFPAVNETTKSKYALLLDGSV